MSELVEFDSLIQLETLLQAGMELKFELSEDDEILNGSPIYAAALNHLREALLSGGLSSSLPESAQAQIDRFQRLSPTPEEAQAWAHRIRLSNPTPERARAQADWYRLSQHPHRWGLIARRAVRHPQWPELSAVELRQWIETLAAPLTVDDETLAAIKEASEAILDGG